LESLLEITTVPGNRDSLNGWLTRPERWDKDEGRKRARQAYPSIPWCSFARVIRLLVERCSGTVTQARAACLEASGIEKLKAELDRRIYQRAAVIKQRLIRVKARIPIESGLLFLNEHIQQLTYNRQRLGDLENDVIAADRAWLVEADRMNLMEMDLAFCEKMDTTPGLIEARDCECIHRILAWNQGAPDAEPIPREVLNAMIARYENRLFAPRKSTRDQFQHLIRRLQEQLHSA
jgi:hypothetical protein